MKYVDNHIDYMQAQIIRALNNSALICVHAVVKYGSLFSIVPVELLHFYSY